MVVYDGEAKTPKTPFVRHNGEPAQVDYRNDTRYPFQVISIIEYRRPTGYGRIAAMAASMRHVASDLRSECSVSTSEPH